MHVLKIAAVVVGAAALALTGPAGIAAIATSVGIGSGAAAVIGAGVYGAIALGTLFGAASIAHDLFGPRGCSGGPQARWKADDGL